MKKLLSFILAVVYLSTSIAAVKTGSACPECRDMQKAADCCKSSNCCFNEIKADLYKNELTRVRAEAHHWTSTGIYKLDPLPPIAFAPDREMMWGRIADDIPLFLRNCNLRI